MIARRSALASVLALMLGCLGACSDGSGAGVDAPDAGEAGDAGDAGIPPPPSAAVPTGMVPTLVSATSVQTSDTSSDGTWVAWSGKAGASSNSQLFVQKADSPLAPLAISPQSGWVDGGDSLWDLVLADSLAVWRGWDGASYRIFAYDLAASSPLVVDLSGATPNANNFHTRGRVVVWAGGTSPNFTVYAYRFDDQTVVTIPVNAVDSEPYPKTDGRFVTWMGGTWPTFDIFLYDLEAASPAAVQLTSGGWNAQPVVDDGVVAWYGEVAGSTEIFFADGKDAAPVPVRVTNNAVADEYPQIDHGVIVWSASDGADTEVYAYDTLAFSPSVIQVTDNATADGAWPSIPRVSNGLIVWSGAVAGVSGGEIFYYDLRAASPAVVRLTHNTLDDARPRVTDGLISWVAGGAAYAARR